MILVTVPMGFAAERKYVVEVMLGEILGIEYRVEVGRQRDYTIVLPNGKEIIITDGFFSRFDADTNYLDLKHIPGKVLFVRNRFIHGEDLPVLYGSGECVVDADCIVSGLDIFASAFFMLSRWEESVIPERDNHQRFPVQEALAFKHNFLTRPVVNEYAEMLWEMLCYLGYRGKRESISCSLVLTHDIDALLKWLGWLPVLRRAMADMVKRRQVSLAFSNIGEYYRIRHRVARDAYDVYDWLMDMAETVGLKAHFYFMSSYRLSGAVQDNHSPYPVEHPGAQRIFARIHERGHVIGFHPGYDTFEDAGRWQNQRQRLEVSCGCRVTTGRQHYLRFRVPHTWQLWEDQQMEVDSTCGYSTYAGFRCGTGHTYSVFNIITRKKLNLKEQPLVFMDSGNQWYDEKEVKPVDRIIHMQSQLIALIEKARRFRTPVTLLYHNNVFCEEGYGGFYKEILSCVRG